MIAVDMRRLLWKELRATRGFLVGLLALGLLMQIAAFTPGLSSEGAQSAVAIALLLPVLTILGLASSAFALEKEADTLTLLQTLGVRRWPLAFAKILAVVGGGATLLALLLILPFCVGGAASVAAAWSELAEPAAIALVAGLAWGLFFSLLFRRTLLALIVAGSVLLAQYGIWQWASYGQVRFSVAQAPFIVDALRNALYVALAVMLVDLALVGPWLAGKDLLAQWQTLLPTRSRTTFPRRAFVWRGPRTFSTLLWQEWRQARGSMLAVVGFAVVSTLFFTRGESAAVAYLAIVAPMVLAGALSFAGELADDRIEFLIQRAVSGGRLWLTKSLLWSAVAVGICFAQIAMGVLLNGRSAPWTLHWGNLVTLSLGFGLGQYLTVALRRPLVAALLGLFLLTPLMAVVQIVDVAGFSGATFELPVAVGLLLGSGMLVCDWMAPRKRLASWARSAAVVLLGCWAAYEWFGYRRVAEIPPLMDQYGGIQSFLGNPSLVSARLTDCFGRSLGTSQAAEWQFEPLPGAQPSEVQRAILNWQNTTDQFRASWPRFQPSLEQTKRSLRAGAMPVVVDLTKPAIAVAVRQIERFERCLHVVLMQSSKEIADGNLNAALGHCLLVIDKSRLLDETPIAAACLARIRVQTQAIRQVVRICQASSISSAQLELARSIVALAPMQLNEPVEAARYVNHSTGAKPPPIRRLAIGYPMGIGMDGVQAVGFSRHPGELTHAINVTGAFMLSAMAINWDGVVRDGIGFVGLPTYFIGNRFERQRLQALVAFLWHNDQTQTSLFEGAMAATRSVGAGLAHWTGAGQFGENAANHLRVKTPLAMGRHFPFPVAGELEAAYLDRESWLRAGELTVQLHQYRKKHGSFPADLRALIGDAMPEIPIDPWTGAPFQWQREGIDDWLMVRDDEPFMPAHQPFLWIPGPTRGLLREQWKDGKLQWTVKSDATDYDAIRIRVFPQ